MEWIFDGVGMKQARKANEPVSEPAIVPVIGEQLKKWSLIELFNNAEGLAANSGIRLFGRYFTNRGLHTIRTNVGLHAAYFNYAVSLANRGDRPGAINALRECIRIKSDFFPPSYINLGRILEDGGDAGAGGFSMVRPCEPAEGDRRRYGKAQAAGLAADRARSGRPTSRTRWRRMLYGKRWTSIRLSPRWFSITSLSRQRQCKWPVIVGSDYVSS